MNVMLAGMIGGMEMVLILAVVLILFGSKKLPELAKGLGQGIKEFKKASREVTDELHRSMEDDRYNTPPQRPLPPANPAPAPTLASTPALAAAPETAKVVSPSPTETKA